MVICYLHKSVIFATLITQLNGNFIPGTADNDGFDFTNCGVRFSCMINLENCKPGETACALFAWRFETADEISVELVHTGDATWVAFGIAPEDDMTNSDIYYCQNRTSGLGVESALALGNTSPEIDGNNTGIIESSVTVSTFTVNGTEAYVCRFRRPISVSKGTMQYSLGKGQNWYITLAKGPMTGTDGTVAGYHGFSGQGGNAVETAEKLELYYGMKNVFIGGTIQSKPLITAHIYLMFIAWGILIPLGITASAILKYTMWDTEIGKSQWFQLHRMLVVVGTLLNIIAFILIFIEKKVFATGNSRNHAIIGCTVTGLCIINPIMGMMRPDKNSTKRSVFNVAHYIVGYSAQFLAFAAILIGIILVQPIKTWAQNVMIFLVCWWGLGAIFIRFSNVFKNFKSVNTLNRGITLLYYIIFMAAFITVVTQLT